MNWHIFFPEGTPVVALPSWKQPRLYVVAYPWKWRWLASNLFPAYRLTARLRRWFLRVRSQVLGEFRRSQGPYALDEFTRSFSHPVRPVAVLVGTAGPTQKLVVQLADPTGRTTAYVKYGESPAARRRLEQEFKVLSGLPDGVGPTPLGLRPIGAGLALFLSVAEGRPLPGQVFPSSETLALVTRLWRGAMEVSVYDHPWIRRLLGACPSAEPWVKVLSSRQWAVVPMHGDLAPWNILLGPSGLRLIDWEYGSLDGFPGVDLAYHVLQAGGLLRRWPPRRARSEAVGWLSREMGLSRGQAEALVRLTALAAYLQFAEDGHASDDWFQEWRRRVWEEP